jgi:hypothetical protein
LAVVEFWHQKNGGGPQHATAEAGGSGAEGKVQQRKGLAPIAGGVVGIEATSEAGGGSEAVVVESPTKLVASAGCAAEVSRSRKRLSGWWSNRPVKPVPGSGSSSS